MQVNLVWLTPPGLLSADSTINSDPQTISRVNSKQLPALNYLNESDEMNYEKMTDKQKKKKYNNMNTEWEWNQQKQALHHLDMQIPSFWEVIPHYRNYERDNTLCNMLSEQFYMLW